MIALLGTQVLYMFSSAWHERIGVSPPKYRVFCYYLYPILFEKGMYGGEEKQHGTHWRREKKSVEYLL